MLYSSLKIDKLEFRDATNVLCLTSFAPLLFLVVGNMGYFSSPKILFQKSKKERDYLDRDV